MMSSPRPLMERMMSNWPISWAVDVEDNVMHSQCVLSGEMTNLSTSQFMSTVDVCYELTVEHSA